MMDTAELNNNFHTLIDSFPSEFVLAKFYALMISENKIIILNLLIPDKTQRRKNSSCLLKQ